MRVTSSCRVVIHFVVAALAGILLMSCDGDGGGNTGVSIDGVRACTVVNGQEVGPTCSCTPQRLTCSPQTWTCPRSAACDFRVCGGCATS